VVHSLHRRKHRPDVTPAGVITTQSKAVKGSEPFGITLAPNGDPWFMMLSADKIATFQLR
jgi:streptogramin lyase